MPNEMWIPVIGVVVALVIMKLFTWRISILPATIIVILSCGVYVLGKNDPALLQRIFERGLIILSQAFALMTGAPKPH